MPVTNKRMGAFASVVLLARLLAACVGRDPDLPEERVLTLVQARPDSGPLDAGLSRDASDQEASSSRPDAALVYDGGDGGVENVPYACCVAGRWVDSLCCFYGVCQDASAYDECF